MIEYLKKLNKIRIGKIEIQIIPPTIRIRTGLARANQLCKKSNISRDTIARMASFKRHEKNAEINPEFKSTPWKDKGYVAWLGWGGTSGVNWAINKLKQIDKK